MRARSRFRVAAAVTIVQVVVIGVAMALRDLGLKRELYLVGVLVAWFGGPALAVRIVRTFHPNEFAGSSVPIVAAVVVIQWIALLLWGEVLAPLLGLECPSFTTLGCPFLEVVVNQASLIAVSFFAAFGAVSLVASVQGRRPAKGPPTATGT